MTIVSVGYDGSVNETQWAMLSGFLGTDYAVAGPDDWKVEVVGGLDRTVQVLPGTGYGHGVVDTSDAAVTVQLPVVASGSRWDLICAHRDWQPPTGVTTFDSVQGSGVQVVPVARAATPGTVDDQPLALVQVTAGQQLPTAVIDLRCWASKVITAASLVGLVDADHGTIARLLDGTEYRREVVSTAAEWVGYPVARGRLAVEALSGGVGAGASYYAFLGRPVVTVDAGRALRVHARFLIYATVAGVLDVAIERRTGGTLGRTFGATKMRVGPGVEDFADFTIDVSDDPPAGTHTYQVIARHSTSFAPYVSASAGESPQISVVDEGAA